MGISPYLAMTAAEIANNLTLPSNLAYMACHFSPYSTGLSNYPAQLPPDSMVILNDRTPISGHDPELIARQLEELVSRFGCSAVLLDLERPNCPEALEAARVITAALPCPVGVSAMYARDLTCPVFLPPVPPDTALSEHLAPWQGREIWLEAALNALQITVTEKGSTLTPLYHGPIGEDGFSDEALLCRCRIETGEDYARFTLWRTPEDLKKLLDKARELGVKKSIGLFQELYHWECISST